MRGKSLRWRGQCRGCGYCTFSGPRLLIRKGLFFISFITTCRWRIRLRSVVRASIFIVELMFSPEFLERLGVFWIFNQCTVAFVRRNLQCVWLSYLAKPINPSACFQLFPIRPKLNGINAPTDSINAFRSVSALVSFAKALTPAYSSSWMK